MVSYVIRLCAPESRVRKAERSVREKSRQQSNFALATAKNWGASETRPRATKVRSRPGMAGSNSREPWAAMSEMFACGKGSSQRGDRGDRQDQVADPF